MILLFVRSKTAAPSCWPNTNELGRRRKEQNYGQRNGEREKEKRFGGENNASTNSGSAESDKCFSNFKKQLSYLMKQDYSARNQIL